MNKKRGSGEGHCRQRKDGRWEYQLTVSYDPNTGKAKRKSIYGMTKTEARGKFEKAKNELTKGTQLEPNNLTLEEWLNRWLYDYIAGQVAPVTFASYKYVISSHIIPSLGKVKLKNLQTADIQRFYSEKSKNGRLDGKEGGLSPRTIEMIHAPLRQALQQATNEELIARNPSIYTKKPPKSKKRQTPLTTEQAREFLTKIRDDWTYPIFLTALHTGMRRSEILGLEWQDIDFDSKTITIKRSVIEVMGKVTPQDSTKNSSSYRTISIPEELSKELRKLKARQNEYKLVSGQSSLKTYSVFTWADGKSIRPSYLSHHIKKLLNKCGLPEVRFHDLRHTFATILLETEVNPKVVSEMLGHSSIGVTLNTYSHVSIEMQSKAAQKIANALAARQPSENLILTIRN